MQCKHSNIVTGYLEWNKVIIVKVPYELFLEVFIQSDNNNNLNVKRRNVQAAYT